MTFYYRILEGREDWLEEGEVYLTIGITPEYVDDGYRAQKALEPIWKKVFGKECVEDVEGTFMITPKNKRKAIEKALDDAGWELGEWDEE